MEEGKICLTDLQTSVGNIVEVASRVAHRDSNDGQAVKQTGTWITPLKPYLYTSTTQGGELINHILFAKANCGEYDVRYSEEHGEAWLYGCAGKFLSSAQMLNMARMEGTISEVTNRLFLLVNSCRSKLDEGWNADLPTAPALASHLKKVAREEDNNNNEKRKKPRLESRKEKGKFKDLTPPPAKLANEDKIKCQFVSCLALFSSIGASKTHFKKVHPDSDYIPPPKEVNPATRRVGDKKVRVDRVRKHKHGVF